MQVCESGSLLKASEVLLSPPGSQQIPVVTGEGTGRRPVLPDTKGMIPTQFGQELLEDSRPILAEWDR